MRKYRFLAGALVIMLLFSYCADVVQAASVSLVQSKSEYVTSAENYLVEAANTSIGGNDTKALFNDVSKVIQYALYYDFLYCNRETKNLSIPENELKIYAKRLNSLYVDFNASYSKAANGFTELKLNNGTKDYKYGTVNDYSGNGLYQDFSTYVTNYLNKLSDENSETVKNKKVLELAALYVTLSELSDAATTIVNWESNAGLEKSFASQLISYIDGLNSSDTYSWLLDLGASAESDRTYDRITVDTNLTFIENLADVSVTEDGTLEVATSPKLSLAYLAILSASAVYTPFVSHVGCAEFSDALTLLSDSDVSEELLLLYNSTKGYKKPLYKRNLDALGDPSGPANLVNLATFLEDIESGNTGALCTIVGNLQYNGSDWVYSQSGEQPSTAYGSDKITVNFNGENHEMTLDEYNNSMSINVQVDGSSESTDTSSLDKGNWLESVTGDLRDLLTVNAYVTDAFSTEDSTIGTSGGRDVYAHNTVTDENAMSAPVLFYGTKYARMVDNLTTALMTNIIKTESWVKDYENASTTYLYVNAFGDVVLDDDTVVLPGAANPLFYKNNTYNPFTVAFMNSYPSILKNTGKFKLSGKSDVGKYLFFGILDDKGAYSSLVGAKITSKDTVETQGPVKIPIIETQFTSNFGADVVSVFKTRKLLFGKDDDNAWSDSSKYSSYCPFIINTVLTVNGSSVFPYVGKDDTTRLISKAIANSMYAYYAVDLSTLSVTNQSKLNDAYMIDAVLINGLNGTGNASGYQEASLMEYSNYTDNSANRKYSSLLNLSNNLFDKINGVSGVIGIKSVYDNPIVGKALRVFSENLVFFFFIVLLVLLVFFSKVRMDLFQCCIFAMCVFGSAYLYVGVLPSLIPAAFNLFTNNAAQTLSYEILSVDAEHYGIEKSNGENLTDDGDLDLDATSFTLYKVQGREMRGLADSLGVDPSSVVGGNIGVINKNAGVYVKNDEICVNTNILFDTLKITGSVNDNYSYTLSSKKTVSSNVDYYIPFYQMVDSLIGKVNDISEIYSIPRKTSTYANGDVKDNYLLYSYVNSKPFVTPGDYGFVVPESDASWTDAEIEAYTAEGTAILEKLTATFGNNVDWLGISKWLYNLSDKEKKTLWAQTMQDLGYYDEFWNPNTEELDDLVTYVNYQTKKFVYDISDQIGTLSDDVMLKVVATRAIIALTQRASDFGHWMYPFTINYEEMKIDDVLMSIFISDYNRYVEMDMDVVKYVLNEHGWLNLIIFDVTAFMLYITVTALNWIVPLFYLVLGVLILVRFLVGKDFKDPLKGYFKVSLIIMGCSTALAVTVLAVKAMNGSVVGIYVLLMMTLLILYVLLNMLLNVLRNFSEFGNTAINVNFNDKLNSLRTGVSGVSQHKMMKTQTLQYNKRGNSSGAGTAQRDRYSLRNSVDDFYGMFHGMYDSDYSFYDSDNYGREQYNRSQSSGGGKLARDESEVYSKQMGQEVTSLVDLDDGTVERF